MKKKKGRFSRFIRPILSLYDLVIVNLVILYHFNFENKGCTWALHAIPAAPRSVSGAKKTQR